jgi:hypothetical protein
MRAIAVCIATVSLLPRIATAEEPAAPLPLTASAAQVQQVAEQRIEELEDAEQALDHADPRVLAAIIRTYAERLDFDAMPSLVRRVTHERVQVRDAARAAVTRFERNAIWQLRELYEELTGQQAERAWNWERTASELYAIIDAPRRTQREALLTRAHEALRAGELEAMASAVDSALAAREPIEDRELAFGHAQLGEQRLASAQLDASEAAFTRAQRLCPACEEHTQWKAQALFARAEASLAAGVVDLGTYERVLALNATHAGALDALDRLTGAREKRLRLHRTIAAGAAALLFLWIALRLARMARATSVKQIQSS